MTPFLFLLQPSFLVMDGTNWIPNARFKNRHINAQSDSVTSQQRMSWLYPATDAESSGNGGKRVQIERYRIPLRACKQRWFTSPVDHSNMPTRRGRLQLPPITQPSSSRVLKEKFPL